MTKIIKYLSHKVVSVLASTKKEFSVLLCFHEVFSALVGLKEVISVIVHFYDGAFGPNMKFWSPQNRNPKASLIPKTEITMVR
mgnify:CR=1 FL=1